MLQGVEKSDLVWGSSGKEQSKEETENRGGSNSAMFMSQTLVVLSFPTLSRH